MSKNQLVNRQNTILKCKNCSAVVKPTDKFCENCGTSLQDNIIEEEQNDDFLLSTGDYKGEYENLGIVHQYHITLANKEKFGDKNLSMDETIENMIDLLIDETRQEGGNGIIWLRVEFHPMQLGGTQVFVYGTMIKKK